VTGVVTLVNVGPPSKIVVPVAVGVPRLELKLSKEDLNAKEVGPDPEAWLVYTKLS
jgi:hypothetical protein